MGGCDLWIHDTSPVPPCVNWYQSKYSEHSYDLTVLATRKIYRHEHVHKSSNRDKSHFLDYSKHDHKSRSKEKSSSHSRHVHKSQGRDESKSSYHSRHVHTTRSRDEGKASYYSKHVYNSCNKDEGKSSSHSRHIHKSQSKNENKSSSHSLYVHKHSSRDEITVPDEIPVPDFSRPLQLIKSLQEYIIAYMATQHAPAITNSESEILEEASCIPETEKLLDSDCLSKGVHKEDSEDVSPQDPTPITFPSGIITPVTEGDEVLSPKDPVPITIPPDTITQATDGDPALITSPPDIITSIPDGDKVFPSGDHALITSPQDFISSIIDDQQVEEVHYTGDPHLDDIIWCDGLPYQQILAPSPTRGMLILLMSCLPSSGHIAQLQSLLYPESLPKIGTIDSLLWKQRPPRRPPER